MQSARDRSAGMFRPIQRTRPRFLPTHAATLRVTYPLIRSIAKEVQ